MEVLSHIVITAKKYPFIHISDCYEKNELHNQFHPYCIFVFNFIPLYCFGRIAIKDVAYYIKYQYNGIKIMVLKPHKMLVHCSAATL